MERSISQRTRKTKYALGVVSALTALAELACNLGATGAATDTPAPAPATNTPPPTATAIPATATDAPTPTPTAELPTASPTVTAPPII